MIGGRSVLNGRRHGVGLVPDDVATQVPTVSLQRQGDSPRQSQQLLSYVLVAQDQPQRTGIAEDSAGFAKYIDQTCDVLVGGFLLTDLVRVGVVPLSIVGRTGDDHIEATVGEAGELFSRVGTIDLVLFGLNACHPDRLIAASVPVQPYILSTTWIPNSERPSLSVRATRSHSFSRLVCAAAESALSTGHDS